VALVASAAAKSKRVTRELHLDKKKGAGGGGATRTKNAGGGGEDVGGGSDNKGTRSGIHVKGSLSEVSFFQGLNVCV
jgi:hypothetical protein